MKRKDYQNYIWYPVTDETYWAEDYPEEFPNCQTIVCQKNEYGTSNILVEVFTSILLVKVKLKDANYIIQKQSN